MGFHSLCPHWINKSALPFKSGVSQAPKQEPAHIMHLASVSFSIESAISFAFGFKPSGSWMQTVFAFCSFILAIAFWSSRLYIPAKNQGDFKNIWFAGGKSLVWGSISYVSEEVPVSFFSSYGQTFPDTHSEMKSGSFQ